jgi:phosphate starvation-inducible PhoH-like protein
LDDSLQRQSFVPEEPKLAHALFGQQNRHLRQIERLTGVRVTSKGTSALLEGPDGQVSLTIRLLEELTSLLASGYPLRSADIEYAERILRTDTKANLKDIFLDTVVVSSRSKAVAPKTLAQKAYVEAIRHNDVVFGVGPAGTGKTYLAMAMAVAMLTKKEVSRIVLVRPAVEAGEKLGFLPGDLAEKVNPYLRPLYDALFDLLDFDRGQAMIDHKVVEVAPLAFMRGRTLNDAFVILDEAQNTTTEQMKMFLTRLGFGSHAVITGDVTQIDLPKEKTSGLVHAMDVLADPWRPICPIHGSGCRTTSDRPGHYPGL